jgi:hypothetical protein
MRSEHQVLRALHFAKDATEFMHGSVVGDPTFLHSTEPRKCECEYGRTIRTLARLIVLRHAEIKRCKRKAVEG